MSGQYKNAGAATEVYNVTDISQGLIIRSRRKVNFTKEEATNLLNLPEFPGDRGLKNKHVDYLVKAMTRKTFRPELVSIITCSLKDKKYRMNGQHTAWARLEMPNGYRCEVEMIHYEAKSEQDVRQLYASIDRSSPRTKANVIESYLVGSEEFQGVKSRSLRIGPQGFALWLWSSGHERGKHDGDDIAYLLKTDYYDLAIKVCSFLDGLSPREHGHIFRAPVVAAMFATFNKAPQIAAEFWLPIGDGVGIEKRGDPRLKLRNYLMQTAVNAGKGGRSEKQQASSELMFRQCVGCWNAFRDGRTLSILRANERGKRARVK